MARKNHNAGKRNREHESLRRSERRYRDEKFRVERAVLGPLSENVIRRERVAR